MSGDKNNLNQKTPGGNKLIFPVTNMILLVRKAVNSPLVK